MLFKTSAKIPQAFPPHKVIIKATSLRSPSRALAYIDRELDGGYIIVNKQHEHRIVITIHCGNAQYELLKLSFVKDMGEDFIWKD